MRYSCLLDILVRYLILLGGLLFSVFAGAQSRMLALPDAPVDAIARKTVITSLAARLRSNYVFPEVADRVAAAIEAKSAAGGYDTDRSSRAFADALSKDLQDQGSDRHLRVRYDPDFKTPPESDTAPSQHMLDDDRLRLAHDGFGISKVERLPGNVGYLDIRFFGSPELVAEAYASAMQLLSGTDALILDLRRNGGGEPNAVANLISYFFAIGDRRHLNDVYFRRKDMTVQFWTLPVTGLRYTCPIYVLTSAYTFSGGEEAAYDLQTQKRATLVGETTGGGANPGEFEPLAQGFVAFIPNGRAINPITKTNWEHVGVKPDILVPAADAMNTAYATILRTLIADAKNVRDQQALKSILARVEKGEDEKPNYTPPKN